ncbi:MAB_1171c family putative transporter [Streptomyces sp. NPDC060027]|uniref:MAB_1171c family putative transporter n=1 Tax=Streptomyces sp. NPDC060027 TaxID=3347040 RepID=UPI003680348A
MNATSLYLIPIVGLCLAFLVHLPVRRKWRVPVIRSGYPVLVLGALTLFHAHPRVIKEVNTLTGITNFSAPLVYAMNTLFSGACLQLVIAWRGGEPERLRRAWRRCLVFYGVCTALVIVLFVLGDAPVERTREFDPYYATTPYISEMILLYLASHSVAILIMMRLCLTWRRDVTGPLRVGLSLIIVGSWFDLGFQASKYTSVAARWFGHDLDFFSTSVAPVLVSAAAALVAAGFTLPRVAGQWDALISYRTLGPLWRALRNIATPVQPLRHWWEFPEERLILRLTNVHDALLRLNPHFDEQVHRSAHAQALAQGAEPDQAAVLAEAEVVMDAIRAHDQEAPPVNADGTYQLTSTRDSGHALADLSRALRHPRPTADALRHTSAPSAQG